MKWLSFSLILALSEIAVIFSGISKSAITGMIQSTQSSIHPAIHHPQYWMYNGQETLLLRGSSEDNLFQLENLKEQLDFLVSVGSNYVRNTMSSRDTGNGWPFLKNNEGQYDLEKLHNKITRIRKLVCIDKLISYNKMN